MSKERELNDQQKAFLDALFTEECQGNIRKAMNIAGYSENTSVAQVVNHLHKEITELAKRVMAASTVEATMGVLGVLRDGNQMGAANKLKAAESILNRAGVTEQKEKEDINLKVPSGGLFILPAKSAPVDPELPETE